MGFLMLHVHFQPFPGNVKGQFVSKNILNLNCGFTDLHDGCLVVAPVRHSFQMSNSWKLVALKGFTDLQDFKCLLPFGQL